jgi:hypothetical protein
LTQHRDDFEEFFHRALHAAADSAEAQLLQPQPLAAVYPGVAPPPRITIIVPSPLPSAAPAPMPTQAPASAPGRQHYVGDRRSPLSVVT